MSVYDDTHAHTHIYIISRPVHVMHSMYRPVDAYLPHLPAWVHPHQGCGLKPTSGPYPWSIPKRKWSRPIHRYNGIVAFFSWHAKIRPRLHSSKISNLWNHDGFSIVIAVWGTGWHGHHVWWGCDSAVALQKHWRDTSTHTNPKLGKTWCNCWKGSGSCVVFHCVWMYLEI